MLDISLNERLANFVKVMLKVVERMRFSSSHRTR